MNPAASSFCNSSPIARCLSSSKRRRRCFTSLELGRTSRECPATSLGMPGISKGLLDEHHFLLAVEGGADLQRLVVVLARVKGHLLDALGGFEAPGVSVRGVQGL